MFYRVNYQFSKNDKLRSGSYCFPAKDEKDAREIAVKKIKAEHEFGMIRDIKKLDTL